VPPQRDPQAVLLLALCSSAMGTVGPTDTFLATGQIFYAGGQRPAGAIVLKSSGVDRARRETNNAEGQQVSVVNGTKGHASQTGHSTKFPHWQMKYARPEHIPAALCKLDLARPRMSVIYLGLELLGSGSVHHIQFFIPAPELVNKVERFEPLISDFHVYLDAQTFSVVKTKSFAFSPNAIENHSDWETYYSDYRAVSGVLMPFRICNFTAGQKLWDIVFTSVQANVPVTASDFE